MCGNSEARWLDAHAVLANLCYNNRVWDWFACLSVSLLDNLCDSVVEGFGRTFIAPLFQRECPTNTYPYNPITLPVKSITVTNF